MTLGDALIGLGVVGVGGAIGLHAMSVHRQQQMQMQLLIQQQQNQANQAAPANNPLSMLTGLLNAGVGAVGQQLAQPQTQGLLSSLANAFGQGVGSGFGGSSTDGTVAGSAGAGEA